MEEVIPDLSRIKRRQREAIKCLLDHPGSYVLVVDDYSDMSRDASVYDDQGNEYLSIQDYIIKSFVNRKVLVGMKTISYCLQLHHTYLYLNPLITRKMI